MSTDLQILEDHEAHAPHPRVIIKLQALQKIKCFADICPGEVNGFGLVDRRGNDFIIKDAFLIRQTAGFANVETDPKALNLFIYELAKAGGDPSQITFQWHSHGNGGVFFSGEDVGTIGGYLNDHMASMVINKRGDIRCRLDLFKPFSLSLEVLLMVEISRPEDGMIRKCQEEVRKNVRTAILDGLPFTRKAKPDSGKARETLVNSKLLLEGGG